MKKITLFIALCFTVSLTQAQLSIGKLFVKKIGVSTGFDQDRINNMDLDYMLGTAVGSENSAFYNAGLNAETLYGGVCENPYLRAFVTLGAPGLKNTFLDLAVVGVFDRYDGLYYSSNSGDPYNYDWSDNHEYVSLNSMSDEVMLEGIITQQLSIANWLKLYGGIGTNLGYTFDGSMWVNGHVNQEEVDDNLDRTTTDIYNGSYTSDYDYQTFETKNAFSQRVFAEIGTGIILFRRFETGLFFRRGVGYRSYVGYGARKVDLHSFGLRMNWIINK